MVPIDRGLNGGQGPLTTSLVVCSMKFNLALPKSDTGSRRVVAKRQETQRALTPVVIALAALGANRPGSASENPDTVAVLPFASAVLATPTLRALNDLLVVTMDQLSTYDIISPSDVDSVLGAEALKDAVGCDDVRCANDIAGALGCRYVLSGSITKLGDQVMVTLSLMDTRAVRAVSRAQAKVPDDENLYEQAVVGAARELLGLGGGTVAPPKASEPTFAPDSSLLERLRASIRQPDIAGIKLPAERQADRVALLDRAVIEPHTYVIPFVRARLGDGLDAEQLELLYAFLNAQEPKLKEIVGNVSPILLAIKWTNGPADDRLSTRFLDSVETHAASLGIPITRNDDPAAKGWHLIQELSTMDQGAVLGTAMHSYAVGGAFRLLTTSGQVKDGFDNRGTAVHISADTAYVNATERMARAAVARLLRQILLDATLVKP